MPLVIDQGEDFACQIVWTDGYDNAVQLVTPARLDIKDLTTNQVVISLNDDAVPEGEIPGIAISNSTGLIQIYIQRTATAAINPGTYAYDLFVTTDDGGDYAGVQTHRLLAGPVTVNKRITVMT